MALPAQHPTFDHLLHHVPDVPDAVAVSGDGPAPALDIADFTVRFGH